MTTNAIRQKIAEHILFADEKKVKAIYTLLQADIEDDYSSYSPQFKAELDKRYNDYKTGKSKMITSTESKKRILKKLSK